jgi:hypothetical protein
VRPISSSSDFFPPSLTFTSRPPLEFHTIDMLGGGMMRFYAGKDGSSATLCALCQSLDRRPAPRLSSIFRACFSRTVPDAALFNAATHTWDFTYNRIVVGTQTSKSLPVVDWLQ